MPGLQERRTSAACTSFRIASDLKDFAPRRFDPLFHFGPITRRKIRLGKALPDTEPIGKRKRRAKKKDFLYRRYLLHPIALHSRLQKMNPWISRPFLQTDLLPSSPLSSRDNRDRENELTFAHEPSVFGAVLSGV